MKRAIAALLVATLLAGCGGESADLFEVIRSGGGKTIDLVVNDGGTATCSRGGKPKVIPGSKLLAARQLARKLHKQAKLSIDLPKGPGSVLHYVVRTSEGRVAFWDTSKGRPKVFNDLVLFTTDVYGKTCRH